MKSIVLAMASVLMLFAGAAGAADVEAGKTKSAVCVACHGPEGKSSNPLWPNLAGQKDQYIMKQLKAFRAGERTDPLMSPMAAGLSDEDIENLAAYFSSIQ